MGFFNGLFITDQGGALQLLENVLVGPIVAALAFVCSVGNVPLAAVLWAGGISFSGVIAFIYADLIVIPIVLIYRKYYGGKVTALIVAIMFSTMVAAALIVDGIFSALGLVPTHRPSIESISERAITWNYTTALNIVFLFVAAGLVALTLRRGAKDPVCGMTVDRERRRIAASTTARRCTSAARIARSASTPTRGSTSVSAKSRRWRTRASTRITASAILRAWRSSPRFRPCGARPRRSCFAGCFGAPASGACTGRRTRPRARWTVHRRASGPVRSS